MGGGGEQAITQSRYVAEKFLGENSVELETWAASRVRPWGRPSKGDYDFSSWMNKKNEALLKAGCLYEYASESQDFRCWLVLRRTPREERFRGVAMDGV